MGLVSYLTVDGEILSETRGGVERDYVPDPLGSTAALLDASQTKTDTWTYWPYGEVRTRTGTSVTPYQYGGTLGYFTDAWGGLYVRANEFRPELSRWQTVDPLWPSELAFAYATNNPVTYVDPSGLAPTCQQGGSQAPMVPPWLTFPIPPKWPGKWPYGVGGDRCWSPAPGHFKPKGPGANCNRYFNACHRGSILACNMYYVCMGAGWSTGIGPLFPIGGPGADCVRGCLLSVLGGASLASCRSAYAQHQQCFNLCGWSPPWPFNWPTWSIVCKIPVYGAPDPGPGRWTTP